MGKKKKDMRSVPPELAQVVGKLAKNIDGKYCYGLPHYGLDAKLKLALVELGDMELFDENEVDVDEHPDWIPFAHLKDESQFLAISTTAPYPVAMWEHETGEIMPTWDSLDDFAAKVLDKKDKTPFEKLKTVLETASKLIEKDQYADALGMLDPWIAQLPKTPAHASFEDEGLARFHNLHGLALKGVKRIPEARAAFELAAGAGDDYAQLNILEMLEDEGDARGALERGAKLRESYVDDYTRMWLARYLAVAHAVLGDPAAAENELRAAVERYEISAPDKLQGVRDSLVEYVDGGGRGSDVLKPFLVWFKPKTYDVSPAQASQNRAWWDSLPEKMREELLEEIDKEDEKSPTDEDIARCLDADSLYIRDDDTTFDTPEALAKFLPLVRLETLSFNGDPDSIDALRALPKLENLSINNDVIKQLSEWPSRTQRDLWKAAEACDRDAIEKALAAGASLAARGDFGRAALHYVAGEHDVELCVWLIERGADPWAGSHGDSTGILGYFADEDRATLEAAAKRANVRHPDDDPWRELGVKRMPRAASFKPDDLDFDLDDGDPLLDKWPKDVRLVMEPPKKDDKLFDMLSVGYRGILVSEKLGELLRGPNVELLPVVLVDHAKKPRAERYFVLNPLAIDCLVVDRCYPQWNHIDRDSISELAALVFDPAKIGSAQLFRVGRLNSHPAMISKDLAKKIESIDGVYVEYAKR